ADLPGAENGHALATLHTTAAHEVKAVSERLGNDRMQAWQRVRYAYTVVGRDDDPLAEATALVGHPQPVAQWDGTLTRMPRSHAGTARVDLADHLVPEDGAGCRYLRQHLVRPTDAAGVYAHAHLSGARSRDLQLAQLERLGRNQHLGATQHMC